MTQPSYQSYVICTSPRSGSTLLCDLLKASGVAGRPGSHFHTPTFEGWCEAYGLTPEQATEAELRPRIFAAALARGRGDTDVFGMRMQYRSLGFFRSQLAKFAPQRPTDIARIEAVFGRTRFFYLKRADKVDQAVSLVKAGQTGLWHRAPDGTEIERLSPPAEPVYDVERLQDVYEMLVAAETVWTDWFQAEGVSPVPLSYEVLSADPLGVLRDVLAAIGLDRAHADGVTPGVAKLADAVSADWAAQLRKVVRV
ncbi:MAG: Stf0 family sulfotransferase [Pseudomonadota bacterium]